MKEKTFKKIFITGIGICVLLYTLILYSITYDVAYDDGYYNGVVDSFTAIDSLYIIIPKDNKKVLPKIQQPHRKFEDDMFVKNYLSTINKAYNP